MVIFFKQTCLGFNMYQIYAFDLAITVKSGWAMIQNKWQQITTIAYYYS